MKLTTGIVALAITAGTAWAQNPNVIQNTKDALQGVQQQQTAASNQALGTTSPGKPSPATTAKPGAAKAAPVQASTTKPATASTQASAKPATAPAKAPAVTAKAPAAPAAKPAVVPAKAPAASGATLKPASAQTSSSSPTLKPATAKAVPATATTTKAVPAQAKVTPVAAKATAQPAVKGTPAKAMPVPVPAKTSAAPVKTAAPAKAAVAPAKAIPSAAPKAAAAKSLPAKPADARATVAAEASTTPEAPKPVKQEDKKYSMTGKRDPFVSPVVNRQSGSGCSTGKKCLDIEQVALRGVVKSDNGMIAVVTNGLNKAYFLRENDPVFNGYVEKITVDSIVFKETFQDRLGKPFTKDVVKRILTPAA
jgi:Tfp pilus assembly protein PilP